MVTRTITGTLYRRLKSCSQAGPVSGFREVLVKQKFDPICNSYSTQDQRNEKAAASFSLIQNAVSSAESYLGNCGYYDESRTSHNNALMLGSLLRNQTGVIVESLNKLKNSQHPIVDLAGDFYSFSSLGRSLLDRDNGGNQFLWLQKEEDRTLTSLLSTLSMQLRAVIVLLVSSVVCDIGGGNTERRSNSLLFKHQALSDITEMIYAAYKIHDTVLPLPGSPEGIPDYDLLQHGNNLAALMGDMLLAKSSRALADLCNAEVTVSMSNAIGDFAESEFLALSENQKELSNSPARISRYSVAKSKAVNFWLVRHSLGLGSLLGNACRSNAIFADTEKALQQFAFTLGENIGLLLQAAIDISDVHSTGLRNLKFATLKKRTLQNAGLPLADAFDNGRITVEEVSSTDLDVMHKVQYTLQDQCSGNELFRKIQKDVLTTLYYIETEPASLLRSIISSLEPTKCNSTDS